MAPADAAEEDRPLVADEFAAAPGEDRRPVSQARAVLLWLLLAESGLTRRLFGAMCAAGLPPYRWRRDIWKNEFVTKIGGVRKGGWQGVHRLSENRELAGFESFGAG